MIKNFDWITYLHNYKDLRDAGIDNKASALTHWNTWGCREGRTFKKLNNISYDMYIPRSEVLNYFVLNNIKYIDTNYGIKIIDMVKRKYKNNFDVDSNFYLKINNLKLKHNNDILTHIYNHGIINGLIYHPKQLLNIFTDIEIKEINNDIYISRNNNLQIAHEFIKAELYDKNSEWYINQIDIKENKLSDEKLLLLVFIGIEEIGITLLNKIISYKNIQEFSIGICFRNAELYEKMKNTIIENFSNYGMFVSKEYGNDIIPSLIMYNRINNIIKFKKIIKLHTKSSDLKWFNDITDFLLCKNIKELTCTKNNNCNCIGPDEYYTTDDNMTNIRIKEIYSNYIDKKYFVRGTMFLCDKKVIDKIMELINLNYKMFYNNNLYDTNIINLTNSPIHALERFFGIIKIS
jgi:hypothetical protein